MYLGLSFWQLANSIMRGIYITVFGGTISADELICLINHLKMGYKSLTAECYVAILSSSSMYKKKSLVLNTFVL